MRLVAASCALLLSAAACGGPSSPTRPSSQHTFAPLVSSARWVHEPEGYRLRVRPSIAGRNHAWQAVGQALSQALGAARPTPVRLSGAVRSSLREQLRCHAVFAPRKPTWDLEAWRPDVGYAATVRARCNP